MLDHVDFNLGGLEAGLLELLVLTAAHATLDVTLHALGKVLEHGRTTGQRDVVEERTSTVDRALENDVIDKSRERGRVVTAKDFRAEKDG